MDGKDIIRLIDDLDLSSGEMVELLETVQEGVEARLAVAREKLLKERQEMIRYLYRR